MNEKLARESALVAAQADASQRAQRVLDLLTAPQARHVVLTAGAAHPAPSARAACLASRGALILEASNLAPLAPDKTYELWIIPASGHAPVPAGLFRPDSSGEAHLVLPEIPTSVEAKALGITVERASGSATPTLPIILSGTVASEGE
jgi:anti-sigma-K factor RskA